MPSFKDANGREWIVRLDAPSIRDVRQELSFDLTDVRRESYERLASDAVLLVDVLYVLCREQAQHVGVTDIQFGRSLTGDAIEAAAEALTNAIADFFPQSKRKLLLMLMQQGKRLEAQAMEKAMEKLGDPELEAKALAALEAELDRKMKALLTQWSRATNSLDGAESAPKD